MTAVAPRRWSWDWFWFQHPSALNLAVARVLVAAQALWILLSRDYPAISGLPSVFWSQVDPSTMWRYLVFPGHPGLERILLVVALLALGGALVGIYARVCCAIAGILLYHLAPLEGIIWISTPYVRGLTIPVLALIILSLSRCDDRLSLVTPGRPSEPKPGLAYSWQLRLIQLLICEIYLFSGWSKIVRTGLDWVSADNIRRWILYLVQDPEVARFQALGLWIASHPTICLLIAIGALALEFGFVSVMFSSTARRWLVPAALAFHIGIAYTMNLTFVTALLLLIFVNWDWVAIRLTGHPTGVSRVPLNVALP